MKSKLTLRIDEELIERAKAVARKRETSVSELVADYLRLLDASSEGSGADEGGVAPLGGLAGLHGCMRRSTLDESDYKAYLIEKHG